MLFVRVALTVFRQIVVQFPGCRQLKCQLNIRQCHLRIVFFEYIQQPGTNVRPIFRIGRDYIPDVHCNKPEHLPGFRNQRAVVNIGNLHFR